MPPENSYNSIEEYKHSFRHSIYNPITTNPVSPYRSWLPTSHSCYTPEIPNSFCFNFSSFKKKTKKEALEIE